jgi:rubredoxin
MTLHSTITCPNCGTTKLEIMPKDRCVVVYDCSRCGLVTRPKAGDCCVFCSYGSNPCPPVQAGQIPTCRPG